MKSISTKNKYKKSDLFNYYGGNCNPTQFFCQKQKLYLFGNLNVFPSFREMSPTFLSDFVQFKVQNKTTS